MNKMENMGGGEQSSVIEEITTEEEAIQEIAEVDKENPELGLMSKLDRNEIPNIVDKLVDILPKNKLTRVITAFMMLAATSPSFAAVNNSNIILNWPNSKIELQYPELVNMNAKQFVIEMNKNKFTNMEAFNTFLRVQSMIGEVQDNETILEYLSRNKKPITMVEFNTIFGFNK